MKISGMVDHLALVKDLGTSAAIFQSRLRKL
jgi:hypothetical protein